MVLSTGRGPLVLTQRTAPGTRWKLEAPREDQPGEAQAPAPAEPEEHAETAPAAEPKEPVVPTPPATTEPDAPPAKPEAGPAPVVNAKAVYARINARSASAAGIKASAGPARAPADVYARMNAVGQRGPRRQAR